MNQPIMIRQNTSLKKAIPQIDSYTIESVEDVCRP